jgi:hypothetical protein
VDIPLEGTTLVVVGEDIGPCGVREDVVAGDYVGVVDILEDVCLVIDEML